MSDAPVQPFDPNLLRTLGHELVDKLADHLESSRDGSAKQVLPYRDPQELYDAWKAESRDGQSAMDVFQQMLDNSIRLHHPRYLGHQISPPAMVACLAGLVADFLNNGMGVYEMGMAGTVMERLVIEQIAEQFGFGPQASGVLTSGGSLANLTALLAARSCRSEDDVWQAGNQRPMSVIVSDQAHYCIERAAGVMGLGHEGLIRVPVDSQFRMRTRELPKLYRRTQDSGRTVIAVVGNACSTATGSYDDLQTIGDFCREEGIWFHVDGAHGAAACFSDKYNSLLTGIQLADSITLDFHKLLLTPALASALVFRESRDSFRTFFQQADYLFRDPSQPEWFNLARRTFECTKNMMSAKVYSILAVHGTERWNENVTRLYDLARYFADQIKRHDSFELLIEPQSNIVCFRLVAEDASRLNQFNGAVRQALTQQGRFYIVQTTIGGNVWLRVTVCNSDTTERELSLLLNEIATIGEQLAGSSVLGWDRGPESRPIKQNGGHRESR